MHSGPLRFSGGLERISADDRVMQQKRVVFARWGLPLLLVAPQLAVTLVFFIWPASQALYQSVLVEDAFGLASEFVWLDNFVELFEDPGYLNSLKVTVIFSLGTTVLSMGVSLLLAVMADRVVRGAMPAFESRIR